jgi:general secretion pathway protein G
MQFLKNIRNSRGFTLIELLVVITIIGILATGGTVTYTSQIQKARDTTRISDMKALQSGIEQFYQDKAQYPNNGDTTGEAEYKFTGSGSAGSGGVVVYVPKLPKDPKNGQSCNNGGGSATACMYLYNSGVDTNNITGGEYKISTGLENSGNVLEKAAKDGGSTTEANRLEIGTNLQNGKSTECIAANTAKTAGTGVKSVDSTICTNTYTGGIPLVIAGNPTP